MVMVALRCFFLVAAVFILIASFTDISSAAVGISPGMYNIDFTPGLREQFTFEFLGDSESELEIYAAGDLARYVELSRKKITGTGAVTVLLKLPQSLETPGMHSVYIGAREKGSGSQGFGIVANVKGTINVFVPYPGQYVTMNLKATSANAGDPVTLTVDLDNLGNEKVSVGGNIQIYSGKTLLTEFDMGEFDLQSLEKKTIQKELRTEGYSPGTYLAVAGLSYGDDEYVEANATVRLGELKVIIANYTRLLERDKINRFEVQVESRWNDPIDGVFAKVALQGYPINFVTPPADLEGFGSTTLTGFFDTTGIQNETFQALVSINYEDRLTEEIVTLSFKKERDYLVIGLVAAVIIIAILVIFVTYVLRRVEKRRK